MFSQNNLFSLCGTCHKKAKGQNHKKGHREWVKCTTTCAIQCSQYITWKCYSVKCLDLRNAVISLTQKTRFFFSHKIFRHFCSCCSHYSTRRIVLPCGQEQNCAWVGAMKHARSLHQSFPRAWGPLGLVMVCMASMWWIAQNCIRISIFI